MTDTTREDFEKFRDARNEALSKEGHDKSSPYMVTNAHYQTWLAAQAQLQKLRDYIIAVGGCPDCVQTGTMDPEGPFSYCGCGTSEDYATRPLQQVELMKRAGVTVDGGVVKVSNQSINSICCSTR